jgi:hypothetical protein
MGYIGQSRSENSAAAIEEGLVTYSELKAWQKRAVDSGKVRRREWHHTGKYYNETNYYDPADFAELKPADFPPVKDEEPEEFKVSVTYAYWTGTKKHPHRNEDTIEATRKGNWLFGDFEDGCKKKAAGGNNIISIMRI